MKRPRAAGKKSGRKAAKLNLGHAPKATRNRRPSAAELQEQLDRRTRELRESLEQQKASAEILSVISNSVADTRPVFDKILESCKHLFGGDELDVLLVDEQGQLNIAAYLGDSHDVVAATFPAPVERAPAGRAIRERRVVHWPDLVNGEDVPGVLRKMAKLIGYRSIVFAPMLCEDRGIGAIGVARSTGPFKPNELAMLQTFAAQAVIAIENTRLLNELRQRTDDLSESLEQQTATSEVLKVISSSPGDLEPVFQTMLENAMRICDAKFGSMFRFDDGDVLSGGELDTPPALAEFLQRRGRLIPEAGNALDRVWQIEKTCVIAADRCGSRCRRARRLSLAGARTILPCRCSRMTSLSAPLSFTARRCGPSPTSRSSWFRISPPRPSSPSRIHGCSAM